MQILPYQASEFCFLSFIYFLSFCLICGGNFRWFTNGQEKWQNIMTGVDQIIKKALITAFLLLL